MTKTCPKCGQDMIKLSLDTTLDEKWICTNSGCGNEESQHHFDDEVEKQTGHKPE